MCSIIALVDKNGQNISDLLGRMLQQTSHRGPDGCGIYVNGIIKKTNGLEDLNLDGIKGSIGLGHSRLKITGVSGIQPLAGCHNRFVIGFNGEIWNYKALRAELRLRGHNFETDSDSEVIVHLIEENYNENTNLSESVLRSSKRLDGEYAFVVFDNFTDKIVLTRDPVGIKPLYYGQNHKYFALCSEKKPLWDLGILPISVLPGLVIELNPNNYSRNLIPKIGGSNELSKPIKKVYDEETALAKYKHVLFDSVRKRTKGIDNAGIIFSGGIDSILIARVAQLLSCKFVCYASGFKDSPDLIAAREAADKLGLELRLHEISKEEIASDLENIISSIESVDHLQVDVALPIFYALKEAKKDSIRVMLTGQGADEIFAGYNWYPQIFKDYGSEKLEQCLWNDLKNLYKDTLEREDKLSMYHSIELRVPYLDPQVINVAMSISEKLKIKNDKVKYIHRKVAQDLGIPSNLAWRKKEAAQHGSNVHNNLLTILENGQEDEILSSIHTMENLGSAYRYNNDTYSENESVQNVLNNIGEKLKLYPRMSVVS